MSRATCTSPRCAGGYACVRVTGNSSRVAATSCVTGKTHSQAGFDLCRRAVEKPALVCKCSSPALPLWCHPNRPSREPQPSPSAPPGHGVLSPALCHGPQAQGRAQPPGHRVPESLGLPAPQGCSWLSMPTLKLEAVSLNLGWVGPQGPWQAWGRVAGLRFPLGYPETRPAAVSCLSATPSVANPLWAREGVPNPG